jgi:hypothetical protein
MEAADRDDPRSTSRRLIALARMGVPVRFLSPELTVLARELCWAETACQHQLKRRPCAMA